MSSINNVLSCVNTTLVVADRVCDYVPFVSTVSNLVDLFEKCVLCCCCPSKSSDLDNRYFSHIKDKSKVRCVILLVPVLGNIAVALYDIACIIGKCIKSYSNNYYESQQIAAYDQQIERLNQLIRVFNEQKQEAAQDDFWHRSCRPTLYLLGYNNTVERLQKAVNPVSHSPEREERKNEIARLENELIELRRESYHARLFTMDQEEVLKEAKKYYLANASEPRTTEKAREEFKSSVEGMSFENILPAIRGCITDHTKEKSLYKVIELEEIAPKIESILGHQTKKA